MKGKARGHVVRSFALALAAAAAIAYYLESPRIASVNPVSFSPGEPVAIVGSHFGASRGNRKVLLDSSPLTQSSYISWSDGEIRVLLPPSVDSGLLKVATPFGASNPEIVVQSSHVPGKPEGIAAAVSSAGPAISSVKPGEATVGSLVTIEGINFGTDLQVGGVKFTRNTSGSDPASDGGARASAWRKADDRRTEPEDPSTMYERWDDKSIAVRVPESAGSGAVTVRTPQGESAPYSFVVKRGSGKKSRFSPVAYSIRFKVSLRKKDNRKGGAAYLYLPNPPDTFSQSMNGIQEESPAAFKEAYMNTAVFELKDLAAGETTVSRTVLVSVSGVESDLEGYKDSFPDDKIPNFLRAYAAGDGLVPAGAKEIQTLAAGIVGKERNFQKKAALIRDWLGKNIRWNRSSGADETPLSALRERAAGSRSFALLACAAFRAAGIPSAPVAGFLVRKDNVSVPHFWIEYYLPAVGWIPYDPVLALGQRPGGFDAGFEDPNRYFGSLDNRHIAISRGISDVTPLAAGSEKRVSSAPWSFQTLFEESSGESYSSAWRDIEILGSY